MLVVGGNQFVVLYHICSYCLGWIQCLRRPNQSRGRNGVLSEGHNIQHFSVSFLALLIKRRMRTSQQWWGKHSFSGMRHDMWCFWFEHDACNCFQSGMGPGVWRRHRWGDSVRHNALFVLSRVFDHSFNVDRWRKSNKPSDVDLARVSQNHAHKQCEECSIHHVRPNEAGEKIF